MACHGPVSGDGVDCASVVQWSLNKFAVNQIILDNLPHSGRWGLLGSWGSAPQDSCSLCLVVNPALIRMEVIHNPSMGWPQEHHYYPNLAMMTIFFLNHGESVKSVAFCISHRPVRLSWTWSLLYQTDLKSQISCPVCSKWVKPQKDFEEVALNSQCEIRLQRLPSKVR